MEKELITIDPLLKEAGLDQELFCMALKISPEELKEHPFKIFMVIRTIKKRNKEKFFWELHASLDDSPGAILGLSGYSQSFISFNIEMLRNTVCSGKALKGIWPPKDYPFILWLQQFTKHPPLNIFNVKEKFFVEVRRQIEDLRSKLGSFKDLSVLCTFLQNPEIDPLSARISQILSALSQLQKTNFLLKPFTLIEEENNVITVQDPQQQVLFYILPDKSFQCQEAQFKLHEVDSFVQQVRKNQRAFTQLQKEKKISTLLAQLPQEMIEKIQHLQKQYQKDKWSKLLLSEEDAYFLKSFATTTVPFIHFDDEFLNLEEIIDWIHQWILRLETIVSESSGRKAFSDLFKKILGLISSSPKYGVKTYAMWLGNSKAKVLQKKNLDQKFRRTLMEHTLGSIEIQIEKLISLKIIEVIFLGRHDLPVLRLSSNGKELYKEIQKIQENSLQKAIPTQKERPPPQTAKVFYEQLCQKIEDGKRQEWLNFLLNEAAILQMGDLQEDLLAKIHETLDRKMPGWQTLVQWALIKHPIKYKPLTKLMVYCSHKTD